jgi:hypothetical protein
MASDPDMPELLHAALYRRLGYYVYSPLLPRAQEISAVIHANRKLAPLADCQGGAYTG